MDKKIPLLLVNTHDGRIALIEDKKYAEGDQVNPLYTMDERDLLSYLTSELLKEHVAQWGNSKSVTLEKREVGTDLLSPNVNRLTINF